MIFNKLLTRCVLLVHVMKFVMLLFFSSIIKCQIDSSLTEIQQNCIRSIRETVRYRNTKKPKWLNHGARVGFFICTTTSF